MASIENLYDLNDEIIELENNYHRALNYICALRQTQAAILTGVHTNQIDKIKDLFIWKDFEKQREDLCSPKEALKDMMHYSTNWNDE